MTTEEDFDMVENALRRDIAVLREDRDALRAEVERLREDIHNHRALNGELWEERNALEAENDRLRAARAPVEEESE